MSSEQVRVAGLYYSVIDGSFRTKVDQDHPQAVCREYETFDGKKATKYERIVNEVSGYIEDIGIYEGDYGKILNIKLDPNQDGKNPLLQFGVSTSYGEDVLKKLPQVDFTKEVTFRPYAFEDNNRRLVRGVELRQGETKHKNYFYDVEAKKAVNGYPTPEGKTEDYSKEDWKIFYLQARKFLLTYFTEKTMPRILTEKNLPKTPTAEPIKRPEGIDESWRETEEEIDPESISF